MRFNLKKTVRYHGFALIEVLVAMAIFASVTTGLYSTITAGIVSISSSSKYITAMTLAKSNMNLFIHENMPEVGINDEPIEGYDGFYLTRLTGDIELMGFVPAKRTDVIISWKEQNKDKKYTLSYIYTSTLL